MKFSKLMIMYQVCIYLTSIKFSIVYMWTRTFGALFSFNEYETQTQNWIHAWSKERGLPLYRTSEFQTQQKHNFHNYSSLKVMGIQTHIQVCTCDIYLTLRLLMSYIYIYIYIYMELLVKPEMLMSNICGPTFGNAETVSFYLLHNVSTLNQCREVSCVTFVCKHFAS